MHRTNQQPQITDFATYLDQQNHSTKQKPKIWNWKGAYRWCRTDKDKKNIPVTIAVRPLPSIPSVTSSAVELEEKPDGPFFPKNPMLAGSELHQKLQTLMYIPLTSSSRYGPASSIIWRILQGWSHQELLNATCDFLIFIYCMPLCNSLVLFKFHDAVSLTYWWCRCPNRKTDPWCLTFKKGSLI